MQNSETGCSKQKKTKPFIEVDIGVPNYSNHGKYVHAEEKQTVRMKGKTGLYIHMKVIWGR